MKQEDRKFQQYSFENHDLEGDNNEFLNETAPYIGFVVHTFNQLEESLNSAICERISDRSDEPGAVVIYKMNFSAKVDLFYRMVRSMEIGCNYIFPSFNSLIENLRKCGTLRNAVVHAEWYNMNEKGYTFVKLNFDKNGIEQHYWQFTPESLKDILSFIESTDMSFENYYEEKRQLFCR